MRRREGDVSSEIVRAFLFFPITEYEKETINF